MAKGKSGKGKSSKGKPGKGKAANKAALQQELGLPVDPDVPMLVGLGGGGGGGGC